MTTLAVGEEDGGGMSMAPEPGSMSMPASDDLQVTTLAIGEEDGGSGQFGYGTMSPIGDDHSIIGGGVHTDRASSSAAIGGLPEGYGTMQPIYSPGEAEYPAFAKTSETPDLLNFHPVARIPKTALPHSTPVIAAPAPISAPAEAQPMVMQAAPVGTLAQDVPISGNYESVGNYEDYIRNLSGDTATPVAVPAAEAVYIPSEPVEMQPAAPGYEVIDSMPAETGPIYEPHEPAAATSLYDRMSVAEPASTYEAVKPVARDTAPVQATAPLDVTPVESAAPVETMAPISENAPVTSAEPKEKPTLFEKDAPFDYTSDIEPADPADGNPDYVPPAAAQPEASYVNVPLDAYLVESPGADSATAAEGIATGETAPSPSGTTGSEPAPTADIAPEGFMPPSELTNPSPETPRAMSLGGSFTVIDQPLPETMTGASSGMGSAGPEAPATTGTAPSDTPMPDTSGNELQIMTLAIGEEAGSP